MPRWGKPRPKAGARRVRQRFLWLPLCIGGLCRWLERVTVREEYKQTGFAWGAPRNWWAVEWIDEEKPLGRPAFWKAGGGPGVPMRYGYGYWSGPERDLLCVWDNVRTNEKAEGCISPLSRFRWLAYLKFMVKRIQLENRND